MSEKIAAFFEAWATADADAVRAAVTDPCYYADPRAPKPITEVDALIEYVGQYSQMAPGATAQVVRTDEVQGSLRLAVEFAMPGGQKQHGQYFAEVDENGKASRLVGFVGFGAPE